MRMNRFSNNNTNDCLFVCGLWRQPNKQLLTNLDNANSDAYEYENHMIYLQQWVDCFHVCFLLWFEWLNLFLSVFLFFQFTSCCCFSSFSSCTHLRLCSVMTYKRYVMLWNACAKEILLVILLRAVLLIRTEIRSPFQTLNASSLIRL